MFELSPLVTAAIAAASRMPACLEPVAVEADPDHLLAAEALVQAAERHRILVDHGHGVALILDDAGEPRADTAAAHDDHMHEGRR